MPEFDSASILLSVLFSGIGFVAFRYGRKMQQTPPVVLGMALMVYPLLVSNPGWMAFVGIFLTSGLWLWRE
ncbi:MAG: amino acid transport protein [Deltaproteobacteria bacterium]|nr:amino acid transport protein [Deltaproteobacteria bacterium]